MHWSITQTDLKTHAGGPHALAHALGGSRRHTRETPGEEKETDHASSRLWQTPPPLPASHTNTEQREHLPTPLLSHGGNYMRGCVCVCSEGRWRCIGSSRRLVSGALFQGHTEIPRDYGKRRAAYMWWRMFYGRPLSGPLAPLSLWVQTCFEFLSRGLKNLSLSEWLVPHLLTPDARSHVRGLARSTSSQTLAAMLGQ